MSRKIKDKEGFSKKPKTVETSVEPVSSEKNLPETASLTETDGEDKISETVQSLPTIPGRRRCECCGATLAMYNTDKLCWPCDRVIAEWRNFPARRQEFEREMSEHCLGYIRKKILPRKKAGNAVGGEISSGSWARASGRKQIERK